MITREDVKRIIYYFGTAEFVVRYQDRDGEQEFVIADADDADEIDDTYNNVLNLTRDNAIELRAILGMILDETEEVDG